MENIKEKNEIIDASFQDDSILPGENYSVDDHLSILLHQIKDIENPYFKEKDKKVDNNKRQSDNIQICLQTIEELIKIQHKCIANQNDMATSLQQACTLGVTAIASNRKAVQEVIMTLNNASIKEISEMERNHIKDVLHQLKEQQDILLIEEKNSQELKLLNESLSNALNSIDERFAKEENNFLEEITHLKEKQRKNNIINRLLLGLAITLGAIGVVLAILL